MRFISPLLSSLAAVLFIIGPTNAQDLNNCPGICLEEGSELATSLVVVPINGVSKTCFEWNSLNDALVDQPALCLQQSQDAIAAGCECTAVPTGSPTLSALPSMSPSTSPPSSSPTKSDAPSSPPTAAAPVPYTCSGICETGTLLNPNELVVILSIFDGNFCGVYDSRQKEVTDPVECANFQELIKTATPRCRCGEPVDCPGICPIAGETVINPNFQITLEGGRTASCGELNNEWDSIFDPQECNKVPDLINEALAKGCKCGVPVECNGICSTTGEAILNPNLEVELSDNTSGTCGGLDSTFENTIDAEYCDVITDTLIDEAISQGCKCGVPIQCPGLCVDPNDIEVILLNPDAVVNFQNEEITCSEIASLTRTIIDPDVCQPQIDEAIAAGCKCGIPFECTGICLDKNRPLFDKNTLVQWDGEEEKCKDVDKIIKKKKIDDEEECRELGRQAIQAGCQCGETTPMPSTSPSMTTPTVSPSLRPTFKPVPLPPSWTDETDDQTDDSAPSPTPSDSSPSKQKISFIAIFAVCSALLF